MEKALRIVLGILLGLRAFALIFGGFMFFGKTPMAGLVYLSFGILYVVSLLGPVKNLKWAYWLAVFLAGIDVLFLILGAATSGVVAPVHLAILIFDLIIAASALYLATRREEV